MDEIVEHIYASHLLEHFAHPDLQKILHVWWKKLKPGGKLTINVPDLAWAAKQLLRYDQGYLLDGYYNTMEGEHGLLSIFYGSQSHEGEYHKSGFTELFLKQLLEREGFKNITITKQFDAHDMGVLIAKGNK